MIHVVTPDLAAHYREEIRAMHRLRYRIFKQRMRWEVDTANGEERDAFDLRRPTYVLALDPDGTVVGSLRLLPTTGPYMLRDVFPQLLAGRPAPHDPRIWESSRCAVECGNSYGPGLSAVSRVMAELFCGTLEYGLAQGLQQMVMVYDMRMARLFRRLGGALSERPCWRGTPQRIGDTVTVAACWDISHDTLCAIRERNRIVGSVLTAPRLRPAIADRVAA